MPNLRAWMNSREKNPKSPEDRPSLWLSHFLHFTTCVFILFFISLFIICFPHYFCGRSKAERGDFGQLKAPTLTLKPDLNMNRQVPPPAIQEVSPGNYPRHSAGIGIRIRFGDNYISLYLCASPSIKLHKRVAFYYVTQLGNGRCNYYTNTRQKWRKNIGKTKKKQRKAYT